MTAVLFRFCGTVAAMPLCAWLLPGVHAASNELAWITGILLGLLYLFLRPFVKLILAPFNCLTLGMVGFLVDIGFVNLASNWLRGFTIDGFWWSLAAALAVSLCREGAGRLAGARG